MGSLLLSQVTKLGFNTQPTCSFSLSQEWNFKLVNLEFPHQWSGHLHKAPYSSP